MIEAMDYFIAFIGLGIFVHGMLWLILPAHKVEKTKLCWYVRKRLGPWPLNNWSWISSSVRFFSEESAVEFCNECNNGTKDWLLDRYQPSDDFVASFYKRTSWQEQLLSENHKALASISAGACGCHSCISGRNENALHMVLCSICGNKRCPHANDHRNTCTGSNEPGQKGSAYE
jgi:hypothetical protein